jgi:hypothetical protein
VPFEPRFQPPRTDVRPPLRNPSFAYPPRGFNRPRTRVGPDAPHPDRTKNRTPTQTNTTVTNTMAVIIMIASQVSARSAATNAAKRSAVRVRVAARAKWKKPTPR